ncbi:MAG TPA: (d)CMP kinase [Porphyromonadaceae bacterium]|nr:(d)CMP kinase [Porphyromonadaceae bacterium]
MKKIIVAIDGYSSNGKSTMARDLAREIGYAYIDTGAMYRAVTLYALRHGYFNGDRPDAVDLEKAMDGINVSFIVNPSTGITETYLDGENVESEIRRMEVANYVSSIAALPFVRTSLVEKQRLMGAGKGIVMDGRDIGTVVFPDAELKIFVTATPEVRARRRLDELTAKGIPASFEEILDNIKNRDYQDANRDVSPLRKADDAIVLDNTDMTIRDQNVWLLEQYNRVVNDRD